MQLTAVHDVAVVGCGPVGAFAANLLARLGLDTVVLEREQQLYPLPRAVHLDHEMMRLFDDAGVLARVEPLMFATDGHVHIGADGDVIRYLGTVGRPRPFTFANDYFFFQPELERALRDGLAGRASVTLRLGTEVTGVRQDDEAATLSLGSGEEVRARYVIATDGARSGVRKALGIALDDLDFEEPWLVVDAEVDGPIAFPAFGGLPAGADPQRLSVMMCDPRRPATVVPGRGNHRRWEFMLLPGESDADMMAPERVAALIAPWLAGVPHRIVRASTYRFHGLVAERWRDGRVLLAGDAAHQTPPFFGQGMCHGLRDVANLAWKLERILAGTSPDTLLDSYQPERDPHVRAVIGAAVAAGRYICQLDPDLAAERDRTLRAAARAAAPGTAADLIPPIRSALVATDAGQRFIQPRVRDRDGRVVRLDQATGGGWVLLLRDVAAMPDAAAIRDWAAIGGRMFVIGHDLIDEEGHLGAWLEAQGALAVGVRPDFYTWTIAPDAASLGRAIRHLADALQPQAVAA